MIVDDLRQEETADWIEVSAQLTWEETDRPPQRLRFEVGRTRLTAWTSPTTTSPISASWQRELAYFLAEAAKIPIVLFRL